MSSGKTFEQTHGVLFGQNTNELQITKNDKTFKQTRGALNYRRGKTEE